MNLINEAVKILQAGGIVVYPTDTAYGLAVDATNATAVKKLYRLKGRDFKNPIHVIPPTKDWIEKLVVLSKPAKKLIDELMPGPLTIVLPLKAKGRSWQLLSSGTRTLGIRRPKYKLALDLAMLLGKPITTTSANLSGQPTCYSSPEVQKQFENSKVKPDYYLDGGKLKKTKPSTVVLVSDRVKILREGPISLKQIKNVLSDQAALFFT
ncbi:MAG TPA: L-threonylcarbamoyladenylate synthase [Methylomirabilota bacterium]|nr:L-threonylcarbamoyladenylate synthase [Methylomirabilota bacterium]